MGAGADQARRQLNWIGGGGIDSQYKLLSELLSDQAAFITSPKTSLANYWGGIAPQCLRAWGRLTGLANQTWTEPGRVLHKKLCHHEKLASKDNGNSYDPLPYFYNTFLVISALRGGFRDCGAWGRNHLRGPCLKIFC